MADTRRLATSTAVFGVATAISRVAGLVREIAAAVRVENGAVKLSSDQPIELLHRLTGWALERSIELEGLEVRRPSLEDIYLELTASPEQNE